jgi:lipid-A-disaccharide synthase-like uncharacterized protein
MKRVNKKQKLGNLAGWLGMVSIQSATLPVTYNVLVGNTTNLPPISMVVMVWLGLILYLIRAIIQKDMLHITSNGIGFFTQSILMALIVFK